MIVLDTDILVLDLRFPRDSRHSSNRRFLNYVKHRIPLALTSHTLLEVIGKLSFGVKPANISKLHLQLPHQYGFQVLPHLTPKAAYAGCTIGEILSAIERRMALGDAINAAQIEKFVPAADCLITWNAKHYQRKLQIPVITPDEWWQQNQPTA
ncbi:MAG TPA: hypothetical protein VGI40_07180 [Pirellulaceae bacterium]